MKQVLHHVIHDVDRDGWGSAALLVAELGPENCHLYPEVRKDGFAVLADVKARAGDPVWLLDIPTPEHWAVISHEHDPPILTSMTHPRRVRFSRA